MTLHFQASRPRHGACYLDFLDVWVRQAIIIGDDNQAYRFACEIAHYARLMHPEL